MKTTTIILIFVLILVSCSKDTKETGCSHLFYKELPNELFTPGPLHSTRSYPIYLSNDTNEKIICEINSGTWFASHWELPYKQYRLEGSNVVDILVNNNYINLYIYPVEKSSYISSNSSVSTQSQIFNDGEYFCNTFMDTNYIGFRIKRGQNYYYGWLRGYINYAYPPLQGARFFDCCFNECPDDSIKVGLKPIK